MLLHPAQKEIAKDTHRFRVLNCGRRFGKTILAVEEMVGLAVSKKGMRIIYYAPTRDDARDITWNILVKKCENILTYKNESRLELRVMTMDGGESSITLYGWEAVQERGKGRGLANDLIVCDEVSSYRNFWEGWDEVLSPTLIDRKGGAIFISTPKGFNHFYELYNMKQKSPDWEHFHYTTYDNPFIPVEEIEREKLTKPEDVFAQEYMADFRKQQGLVYREFDRKRHVIAAIDPNKTFVEYIAGIDFGYTNPAAVIHIKRDRDDNYFVVGEWYKTQRTEEQIGEYVRSCNFNRVYPDPESASAIEVLNQKGVSVVEVNKGKDSIKSGISKVRELLKRGKLFIHQDCVALIAEFETYRYPDPKPDKNEDENPVKEDDHALDALRYALTTNKSDHLTPEELARRHIERMRNIASNSR
jgi:PBSX family phage terminase large subunit